MERFLAGGLHRPVAPPFPVHRAEPVEASNRAFPLVKPLKVSDHGGLLSPGEVKRFSPAFHDSPKGSVGVWVVTLPSTQETPH